MNLKFDENWKEKKCGQNSMYKREGEGESIAAGKM